MNKAVLIVLDGWGISRHTANNAIAQAQTPHWDHLWQYCPHSLLAASGHAVGLPEGQMGNSEVGHSTLGAGRVLWQSLAKVDQALVGHGFAETASILSAMDTAKTQGRCLHLFGLLSDGGVHSHVRHLQALVRLARAREVPNLAVHAILDGRDVAPRSALKHIQQMNRWLAQFGYQPICDVVGRYWAMDRDNNWERTARAWALYVKGEAAAEAESAEKALAQAYAADTSDEFIEPVKIRAAPVQAGDILLFANFRADRMRQLVGAFCSEVQVGFDRTPRIKAQCWTMTEYQSDLPVEVVFPPEQVCDSLGEVLQQQSLKQLRIAETEKFAHVTYFFSCGREKEFEGEQRILMPSPSVATYDLKPEMSAVEITDQLVTQIESGDWQFALCNFANGDMVGHTGDIQAAIKAVECLDQCLGRIRSAALHHQVHLLITADHGNLEQMMDHANNQPHTAHTLNPVPLVYCGCDPEQNRKLRVEGTLADVAPTLLALWGIRQPEAMTGRSLFMV
ncbi:MAG: 2,3-bisphosphoglycerate-independent phosphoglycerate mutase [Gammaproteobacteria bacterium]